MRKLLLLMLIGMLLALTGCDTSSSKARSDQNPATKQSNGIKEISVKNAYTTIKSKQNIILIDVRTPQEYDGPLGRVAESKLMPVQELDRWSMDIVDWKDREILLICRSGRRSGIAAKHLADAGFSNVTNISGGMLEWNKAELPVMKKVN